MGLGYVAKGAKLPKQSVTAGRLFATHSTSDTNSADGGVASEVWFDSRRTMPLWEESVRLGGTGLALTFLTPQNKDDDYDE